MPVSCQLAVNTTACSPAGRDSEGVAAALRGRVLPNVPTLLSSWLWCLPDSNSITTHGGPPVYRSS